MCVLSGVVNGGLDEFVRKLREHRGDLVAELSRVDRMLAAAGDPDPPEVVLAGAGPPGGSSTDGPPSRAAPPRPSQGGTYSAKAEDMAPEAKAVIKKRLANMRPGTAIAVTYEIMKGEPDVVWTADTLNARLAERGMGQDSADPVNAVRGTLSRLWRGDYIARRGWGQFQYVPGGADDDGASPQESAAADAEDQLPVDTAEEPDPAIDQQDQSEDHEMT